MKLWVCSVAERRFSDSLLCAGCVSLQGFVFIIGGNDAAALPMSSVTCFDPLMDSWRTATPLPVESSGLGACVFGAT